MKKIKILKYTILAILIFPVASFKPKDDSPEKQKLILDMLMGVLSNAHYSPQAINNKFSENVYKTYLNRLDRNKWFFLQSDIDEFKKYKYKLDDEVKNNNLHFYNITRDRYKKRVAETKKYLSQILKKPFDFTKNEYVEFDADKQNYARSKKELKDRWRRYYKYQVLVKLANKLDFQEKSQKNNDTNVVIKSFKELEKNARNEVKKTYSDWYYRMLKITNKDIATMYFNSIASYYDPHSNYFPPEDKEDFDIQMSGKLEGIGAQLTQPNSYIKIARIIPGSPCWKQGELEEGDLILEVAQKGSEPVNVVDMRLDEAIKMIRGKKGTTVILTVKKQNGKITKIPIVRDVVEMEATFARSFVINKGNEKIGYLILPQFYTNMGKEQGRSSASDVKKELQKLKNENINKLILDLRNNGGGSLNDAIKIVGFFIKKGPVVQVRSRYGNPRVLSDTDSDIVFKGKVVVMINGGSASASEITAAALQDYKRAIIAGPKESFGKGTVQRFLPFDEIIKDYNDLKPLGALKVTIQKYYRINGGSTQLKGVKPDIILPDVYSKLMDGEKDMDYPIKWDEIVRADYKTENQNINNEIINNFNENFIKNDTVYDVITKYSKYLYDEKDKTKKSLNLKKFREKSKKSQNFFNRYKNAIKIDTTYKFSILKADSVRISTDSVKMSYYQDGVKRLKKDVHVKKIAEFFSELN